MGDGDATKPIPGDRDLNAIPCNKPLFDAWQLPTLVVYLLAFSALLVSGCGTGRCSRGSREATGQVAQIAQTPKEVSRDSQARLAPAESPRRNAHAVVQHVAAKFKPGELTTRAAIDTRLLDTQGPEFLAWARENLQSGDICFSMSDARAIFGLFPFSRIMIKMTDSRFSHTAIVSREADSIYVYDTAPGGPRRIELATYIQLQGKHAFAIKRLDRANASAIPAAIAYCQGVFARGGDFDMAFAPDDKRYYCVELTQKAYASGGVKLSEPVRMDCFPRYQDYPFLTRIGTLMTDIRTDRGIFIPGNDSMGVWASPNLELVYDNGKPGIAKVHNATAQ